MSPALDSLRLQLPSEVHEKKVRLDADPSPPHCPIRPCHVGENRRRGGMRHRDLLMTCFLKKKKKSKQVNVRRVWLRKGFFHQRVADLGQLPAHFMIPLVSTTTLPLNMLVFFNTFIHEYVENLGKKRQTKKKKRSQLYLNSSSLNSSFFQIINSIEASTL